MLTISKTSVVGFTYLVILWLYSLFFRDEDFYDHHNMRYRDYDYSDGKVKYRTVEKWKINTNLCKLMRVLFLWGPLYLVIWAIPVALAYIAFWRLPVSYMGIDSFLMAASFYLSVFGLITVVILGLREVNKRTKFLNRLGDKIDEHTRRRTQKPENVEPKQSSVWSLVKQFFTDLHDQVCTLVKIKD